MDTLISAEGGLVGLALASFLAATLVPLSSEALLAGYLVLYPGGAALAVAVATLANTAGGMTTYALGRLLPDRARARIGPRVRSALERYGSPATLFAWLPVVGDALCLAAGWLRLAWLPVLLFMAAGRFARYVLLALGVTS